MSRVGGSNPTSVFFSPCIHKYYGFLSQSKDMLNAVSCSVRLSVCVCFLRWGWHLIQDAPHLVPWIPWDRLHAPGDPTQDKLVLIHFSHFWVDSESNHLFNTDTTTECVCDLITRVCAVINTSYVTLWYITMRSFSFLTQPCHNQKTSPVVAAKIF